MRPSQKYLPRLGAFVMIALGLLVTTLFLIGRNQHLIGSRMTLRAHFDDVAGLRVGNNIRYSGIEIGTVRRLHILNDTTVEVEMSVKTEMGSIIRKNAVASLGADGLMGNKVINIMPGLEGSGFVQDGDLLSSRGSIEIEDVLRTLSASSENIREITDGLRSTVQRINNSQGLWKTLQDTALAANLQKASRDLAKAGDNARVMTSDIRVMVGSIRSGDGPIGTLIRDTALAKELKSTIHRMETVASHAEKLAGELQGLSGQVSQDYANQGGVLQSALRDTSLSGHINRSLRHVEEGTRNFNENMEALKHNFLFRGYFRKKSKEQSSN